MAKYKLTPESKNDIFRIWSYGVECWGETQADQYIFQMTQRFQDIAKNPLRYPIANNIENNYRRTVCGADTIYYRIAETGDVIIVAIIGRQDTERWL